MNDKTKKTDYQKPQLTRMDNIRDITFECPQFSCSIPVPPAPPQ